MSKDSKVRKIIPIAIILLLAALVRFTTLSKLMVFTPDEEYLLYIAQTIIKHFHIIWIGVSALGFDLYMGPFWIYIIYPFVALAKGDPVVIGVITSVLGVFCVLLLYFLGKKMFNQKVGTISSLLYASSSLIVYYDQQPYPPGVPFLSLLLTLSLYMSQFSNKWWIFFAFLYGMVFHIHLSLLMIIFVAFYWAILERRKLSKKVVIISILTFLLTVSPLIAFDYFHKGSNITVPIRILKSSSGKKAPLNLDVRFFNFFQSLGRAFYLDAGKANSDEILYPCMIEKSSTTTKSNPILSLVVLSGLAYFFLRKDTLAQKGKRLIFLLSLSFLVPFGLLSIVNPIEYYLLGFFPLLFLIIPLSIESLPKLFKSFAYVLLFLFMAHGLFTVFASKGDFGLEAKKKLILKVMDEVGDKPYEITEEGFCNKYGGWRYLFSAYTRRPERSSEDKTFSWLYPKEVSNKLVQIKVTLKETRSNVRVDDGAKKVLYEGGYSAYIYEY